VTVGELLAEVGRLWPRQREHVQAWARQYADVLGPFAGEQLARAWSETLRTWAADRPPPPAAIAKALPESPAPSRTRRTGEGPPLTFGGEHFDICRRVQEQLLLRWRQAQGARLDDSGPAHAASLEANTRAREQAAAIVQQGFRDAPATAWIPWTEEDWRTMEGRARSQARFARVVVGPHATLKPLHVPMPGLSGPARAPPAAPTLGDDDLEATAEADL